MRLRPECKNGVSRPFQSWDIEISRSIYAIIKISISQLWKDLEPPFLHSGLSLLALYRNREFQEDQRNSNFNPPKKTTVVPLSFFLNLMALYQNPEFQEDQRNSKFRPPQKNKTPFCFLCEKNKFLQSSWNSGFW